METRSVVVLLWRELFGEEISEGLADVVSRLYWITKLLVEFTTVQGLELVVDQGLANYLTDLVWVQTVINARSSR